MLPLSPLAQNRADETQKRPQLVLQIEGLSTLLGIGDVQKYIRIGDPDLYVNDVADQFIDWLIGSFTTAADQKSIISWEGSSESISQQLNLDQGGSNSVSGIQIALLDVEEFATRLITPGEILEDIMGRRAYVWLGFRDTAFPNDFTPIFSGVIDDVKAGATIILNIAHPEAKKRGDAISVVTTNLTSAARFRSLSSQGILYRTRRDVVGTVTVQNNPMFSVAGSETVTVLGNSIIVNMSATPGPPGTQSTAKNIRDAIEKSLPALSLITVDIEDDADGNSQSGLVQNATGALTLGSDTTIQVKNTAGFLLPSTDGTFRTFIRIDDEVIEYTGISGNSFTGCTREALRLRDARAFGAHHDNDEPVDAFYMISGNAIDMALKLMMSGGEEYFVEGLEPKSLSNVDGDPVPGAIFFEGINVQDQFGVVPGDFARVTGDVVPGNNVVSTVQNVVVVPAGSYVLMSHPFVASLNTPAVVDFKSKYNVWPEGLGMGGDMVDVPQFEYIKSTFPSSIFSYEYYIKSTIQGKDFIDKKLLFPTGAFTIPRKGKSSCGYSSPPIGIQNLVKFDQSTTRAPGGNRLQRSVNRDFYNTVVFKYNEAVVDTDLKSGDVVIAEDSRNRINVGKKQLTIEVPGLRPSDENDGTIQRIAARVLDRFKFGTERIVVEVEYGKSFNLDLGDPVLFGGEKLKLPDTKAGSRGFSPRIMEIQNRKLSIKTGLNTLELVDTGYSVGDARYGVVSPASLIQAGATTTTLPIANSFAWALPQKEREKWTNFIGQKVLVHSTDWTQQAEVSLIGFDENDDYLMLVEELPFVPSAGFVVEIPQYQAEGEGDIYKQSFVYTDPAVPVVSGIDTTSLVVSSGNVGRFREGCIVLIHNADFTQVSPELRVDTIAGNTLVFDGDIGFLPSSAHTIELIGFADEGAPYRFL